VTGTSNLSRISLMVLLAAVGASACAKKNAPSASAPPSADAAGADEWSAAEPEGDAGAALDGEAPRDYAQTLPDYEAELDRLEGELASAGVEIPGVEAGDGATPASDGDRCTRVCGLADAICDLEANICRLASEHEDDERYTNACARAQTDCERAESACEECGEG